MKRLRITDRAGPDGNTNRPARHGRIVCPILRGLTAGLSDCAVAIPSGNANERLLAELGRPEARAENCIAGVLCADPFIRIDRFLTRLADLGVAAVTNWPSGIFLEGTTADAMAAVPAGFPQEVEWLCEAKRAGLDTHMFVVSREQGLKALSSGLTNLILHPGLSYRPDGNALRQLEKSLASIARALREARADCEVLLYRHPDIFGTQKTGFDWADGVVDYEVSA